MKFIKYIAALAATASLSTGFTACQDDFDAPASDAPVASKTPNTTIAQLKETYWQEADNYADTIRETTIISGRVISSDEASNVFKSLVIQDETGALAFSINSYNLYLNYRVGQEVVIDATGMYIGKYSGLMQMGTPGWYERGNTWQISFMAPETFAQHAELSGWPEPAEIDTLQIPSIAMIGSTPEDQRKYQSQLVTLQNVSFQEGGKELFSEYHSSGVNRVITDANGTSMNVRTSGYSSFWNTTLPEGNIDLTGILSFFNNAWQFILIDGNAWKKAPERPGAKDNPYTVDQAIASEKAGLTANGWVKGYIVGAVAPGIETVESSDDIEWEAPTTLANTLVIGQSADTRDLEHALIVYLTSESAFEKYGNLRDNPGNLGKEILVQGNLDRYLGTYGITGNNGTTSTFEIDGVTPGGGETGEGDGTENSPYNVAQVIQLNPSSTQTAVQTGVWVKGYIVGFIPEVNGSTVLSNAVFTANAAVATNLVLGPTADCTDASKCIGIQLPAAVRSALNLKDNPGNLGKTLTVLGDVFKYCGAPGIKNTSKYVLDGSEPEEPTGEPSGDGTEASPFNSVAALELAKSLAADTPTDVEYYVKGIVSSIKEISTQFGNATYTITSEGTTTPFSIYRGYYLNGDKFTSADQLKIGDEVVVCGKFVNYMGNTPQMNTGSKLISVSGSSEPVDPPTPPTPPSGDGVSVTAGQIAACIDGTATVDGYSFTASKGSGATAPANNVYNDVTTLRLYADNTFTIAGPAMAKIVFTLNTATGARRYTTFTPNTGTVAEQKSDDAAITWTGNATTVTFTVGHDATLGSDGSSKRGQVHISSVEIFPAE